MISASTEKTHVELMRQRFDDALPPAPLPAHFPSYSQEILTYFGDHLDKILKGSPEDLLEVVLYVKRRFPLFHKQAKLARSGKAWKANASDAALVSLVEDCFDYEKFSRKDTAWSAYLLVDALGGRICPYCRLHHINYHMPLSKKKGFALRPPLDHFLPKSRYPYLAVSLGNLVPCCSQCNSGVKLAMDPLDSGITHPSSIDVFSRISFSAKGSMPRKLGGQPRDVALSVYSSDTTDAVTRRYIDEFQLSTRYAWYVHEVHDLFGNYERFSEYPKSIRNIVLRSEFVLGFPPDQARNRALGMCMIDIFGELERGEIV